MSKKYLLLIIPVLLFLLYSEFKAVNSTPIHSWTEESRADCAVVLTGGPSRIQEGISLLNQQRVKKVLISGVNPNSTLLQIFPAMPFYGSLAVEDIILEKKSKTTYGNAQQSMPILGALNCSTVILITSRLHMNRAMKVFKKNSPLNIEFIPRAVYFEFGEDNWQDLSVEVIKSLFYNIWAY